MRGQHVQSAVVAFGLVAALLASAAEAREIHVAPAGSGGNNANSGDDGSPYETLVFAESQAMANDEIVLHDGTYAGDVTIDVADLTVRSADGEWATVQSPTTDSGQAQTIWVNTTGVTLRRLEVVGGYFYAVKFEQGANTIDECRIRGSGRDCVKIVPGCDGITIKRSEIHSSGQRDGSNAEGVDIVNADNVTVRDCYIHDTATNGIYSKGGSINTVFERLLVMNTGGKGIQLGQDTDDVWFDTVANPGFYENIDGIVRNCIVVNCTGAGLAARAALRPKFIHNTCVNVSNSQNGGIYVASTFHSAVGEVATTDATFLNNIIVLANASARPTVFITANGRAGSLTLNGNRYQHIGKSAQFTDEGQSLIRTSLSNWQSSGGYDANSTEGDPQLDADYHLTAGSGLIGQAETTGDAVDDFDGDTRTSPFDIGADEHNAGTALETPPPGTTLGTGGDGAGQSPAPGAGGEGNGTSAGGCALAADAPMSGIWHLAMIALLIAVRRFAL